MGCTTGVQFLAEVMMGIFLFVTVSRPDLGSTQPPIHDLLREKLFFPLHDIRMELDLCFLTDDAFSATGSHYQEPGFLTLVTVSQVYVILGHG
jgi:hypothetical protein